MATKKGQIQGQIIIYILMIVIFGAILIYGVYAINQLIDRANKVEIEKFKLELKSFISDNKGYGSVESVSFKLPSNYEYICFRDSKTLGSINVALCDTNTAVYAANDKIKSCSKDNMFLYPTGIESDYVGELEVNTGTPSGSNWQNAYCFKRNSQGYVDIKVYGKGDETEILTGTGC